MAFDEDEVDALEGKGIRIRTESGERA
jgi:hypothetical protein